MHIKEKLVQGHVLPRIWYKSGAAEYKHISHCVALCFFLFKVSAMICSGFLFRAAPLKWTLKSTTRKKAFKSLSPPFDGVDCVPNPLFEMHKHSVQASGPCFSSLFWLGGSARETETDLDSSEKQLRGVFTDHTFEHRGGWVACINRPDLERALVSVCVFVRAWEG